MAEISNAFSINSIDTSMQKSSSKPKSIVWGTHIKQGNEISKDNLYNKASPDVHSLFLDRLATRELDASTSKNENLMFNHNFLTLLK
ncbi:21231_t:CDS:2, partial [Gigaspora rosea]